MVLEPIKITQFINRNYSIGKRNLLLISKFQQLRFIVETYYFYIL